jgi:hypothetical protein
MYSTDNRWSPGASWAEVPDGARAAYSARWIDLGDDAPADILGDRQGLAYNSPQDRDDMILFLVSHDHRNLRDVERDAAIQWVHPDGTVAMRRTAGYVYVDAWLT